MYHDILVPAFKPLQGHFVFFFPSISRKQTLSLSLDQNFYQVMWTINTKKKKHWHYITLIVFADSAYLCLQDFWNVVDALLSNTMPPKQASMVCLPSRVSHPFVAKLRMPPTVLSGVVQLSAHGNNRKILFKARESYGLALCMKWRANTAVILFLVYCQWHYNCPLLHLKLAGHRAECLCKTGDAYPACLICYAANYHDVLPLRFPWRESEVSTWNTTSPL